MKFCFLQHLCFYLSAWSDQNWNFHYLLVWFRSCVLDSKVIILWLTYSDISSPSTPTGLLWLHSLCSKLGTQSLQMTRYRPFFTCGIWDIYTLNIQKIYTNHLIRRDRVKEDCCYKWISCRRSPAAEAIANCLQAGQGLQFGRFFVWADGEEWCSLWTPSNPAPHAPGSVLLAEAPHLRGLGRPPFSLLSNVWPSVSCMLHIYLPRWKVIMSLIVWRRPEVLRRIPPIRVHHPDVLGVDKSMYFVTHSHNEEAVSSFGLGKEANKIYFPYLYMWFPCITRMKTWGAKATNLRPSIFWPFVGTCCFKGTRRRRSQFWRAIPGSCLFSKG